jgi:hypothetical protein
MEGTDAVGFTRIGERSLFPYQRGTSLASTPRTDNFHTFLLRSDTQAMSKTCAIHINSI